MPGMNNTNQDCLYDRCCCRRPFLGGMGTVLAGIALAALLERDGFAHGSSWSPTTGLPHFPPKAKSVIWLFMNGGVSHVESFDPKPMLNKYAGKTIAQTPFKDVQNPEKLKLVREFAAGDANGLRHNVLYPLQVGYRKRGRSGIEVSDWF